MTTSSGPGAPTSGASTQAATSCGAPNAVNCTCFIEDLPICVSHMPARR